MRKIALFGLLLCCAGTAVAAPNADLWQRWTKHDPNSHATIEHSAWTKFLQKYVVRGGKLDLNRVRYKAVSDADRKSLEDYNQRLENSIIDKYNRDQQRAFSINLYNAETVDLILQHYPDDALIEAARARAHADHTTLNEEFRRWLADYARHRERLNRYDDTVAALRGKPKVGRSSRETR